MNQFFLELFYTYLLQYKHLRSQLVHCSFLGTQPDGRLTDELLLCPLSFFLCLNCCFLFGDKTFMCRLDIMFNPIGLGAQVGRFYKLWKFMKENSTYQWNSILFVKVACRNVNSRDILLTIQS